jgi:hypothetical protein
MYTTSSPVSAGPVRLYVDDVQYENQETDDLDMVLDGTMQVIIPHTGQVTTTSTGPVAPVVTRIAPVCFP